MNSTFSREFVFQLFALIISVIIVHGIYVTVVWPNAEAVLAEQSARMSQDPNYVAESSIFVIVKDYEQETCFVLMLWCLAMIGYKGYDTLRERKLLAQQLIPIAEGVRVLPEDTREYARALQALPAWQRNALLPRTLLNALIRFGATRNVQDVASSTHQLVSSEADRLESELSMVRYILWAIPAIGFIGTVRGIGLALNMAHRAVEGDVSGVTQSLGTAFNSTLIALLISIPLMFLVHQLQLMQERLVFDAESYTDDHLIRHLHTS
ncbi:MAG: MotA/TolQ/ExbB proton channel family protein [Gammaproteobacteria bacterium]|jgi:biopolymer transport protein ExbB/TolQ|nr:MotA/TolQ/ExbB proton channel family protein [Gammaproteobacteria bacterium]